MYYTPSPGLLNKVFYWNRLFSFTAMINSNLFELRTNYWSININYKIWSPVKWLLQFDYSQHGCYHNLNTITVVTITMVTITMVTITVVTITVVTITVVTITVVTITMVSTTKEEEVRGERTEETNASTLVRVTSRVTISPKIHCEQTQM